MGVSKNLVFPKIIPFVHRAFHYFTIHFGIPLFLVQHPYVKTFFYKFHCVTSENDDEEWRRYLTTWHGPGKKRWHGSWPLKNVPPFQWLFLVPLKGGRWHIIPQLAVYTIYIPLYTTYILPSGGLYATHHLLGELETTIDHFDGISLDDDHVWQFVSLPDLKKQPCQKKQSVASSFLFFLGAGATLETCYFHICFFLVGVILSMSSFGCFKVVFAECPTNMVLTTSPCRVHV